MGRWIKCAAKDRLQRRTYRNTAIGSLSIAFSFLIGANVALACDTSRIGTLAEHVPAVFANFETVQTILRQVPLNDPSVVRDLRLQYEDMTIDSPIFVGGNTIFFNKAFVRLVTHSAIQDAFQLETPVLELLLSKPEVGINFRRELVQRTFRDVESFIFPQFIGLSHAECIGYWDNPIFLRRLETARSSFIQFWLLHEIGHVELGHLNEGSLSVSENWKREHEADIWAFEVFEDAFGPELAIAFFSATYRTFDNFNDGENFFAPLIGSPTHPPSYCRSRRIFDYLQESFGNRPNASVLMRKLESAWWSEMIDITFEYGVQVGGLRGAKDDYCNY